MVERGAERMKAVISMIGEDQNVTTREGWRKKESAGAIELA